MRIELIVGSSFLVIPTIIYGIYGSAVLFYQGKNKVKELKELPQITVFFPAWNEEKVIDMRIKNLADIDYPKNLIKVLIVDDASADKTRKECLNAFKKYDLNGEIITNKKRKGTNYNYNLGIKKAKTEIILTTDADVIFDKKAIKEGLKVLNSKNVGAICGELKPIINKKSIATSTEKPYRDVYGKMCTWESDLDSTYCFNGPFILLKKKAFHC